MTSNQETQEYIVQITLVCVMCIGEWTPPIEEMGAHVLLLLHLNPIPMYHLHNHKKHQVGV